MPESPTYPRLEIIRERSTSFRIDIGPEEAGFVTSPLITVWGGKSPRPDPALAQLVIAAPPLLTALKRVTKEYIAERDVLYECSTDQAGRFCDWDSEQAVAEMDEIIDECRAAIALAEGKPHA